MPTTSNFGWTTPADTDLVKDGAAAIRTLGNGIDTSLLDLKGGTSGQILAKNSNTDLDYTWITPNVGDITEVQAGVGISVASGTGPIPIITNSSTDLITTAGDLLYGTAADTVARLGIGTANQVLAVNSGGTAPQWVTPSSGALVKLAAGSLSGTTISFNNIFTDAYTNYLINWNVTDTDGIQRLRFRVGGSDNTSTDYFYVSYQSGFSGTPTWGLLNNSSSADAALEMPVGSAGNRYTWSVQLRTRPVSSTLNDLPKYFGTWNRGSLQSGVLYGGFASGTDFDGFTVYNSGSTWSGTYEVYGYAK